MAYEISEGAAAGAMWIPTNTLSRLTLNNDFEIWEAMVAIYNNLQDSSKVVGTPAEKAAYMAWMDPTDTSPIMMTRGRNIVRNPNPVPSKLNGKTWDARVTAVIHGYSSALAAKKWMRQHRESENLTRADKVYLTGGAWDSKIKWLQVSVGGWKDYNSSDLVLVRGDCYYGISLKKKDKPESVDPPMINKSVMELLKSVSDKGDESSNRTIKKMMIDLGKSKAAFFGNIILDAKKGPLRGSTNLNDPTKAFYTQLRHPKSDKGWISLIDLKGPGALELENGVTEKTRTDKQSGDTIPTYQYYVSGVSNGKIVCTGLAQTPDENKKLLQDPAIQHLFGVGDYDKEANWDMRKFVNGKLGSEGNKFYGIIERVLLGTKIPYFIGSILVSSVLKTELNEAISNPENAVDNDTVKRCANCHFGFALITAVGKYEKGKMIGSITAGNVKEHPTIQGYLASISPTTKDKAPSVSEDKWIIKKGMHDDQTSLAVWKREEAERKGKEAPAKLFFTIGIKGEKRGKIISVLDLEVRYKGTFTPYPQFIGGMSDDFIAALKDYAKNPITSFLAKECGS